MLLILASVNHEGSANQGLFSAHILPLVDLDAISQCFIFLNVFPIFTPKSLFDVSVDQNIVRAVMTINSLNAKKGIEGQFSIAEKNEMDDVGNDEMICSCYVVKAFKIYGLIKF